MRAAGFGADDDPCTRRDDLAHLYADLPVEVAAPELPDIPDRRLLLTDFGAVGDGVTDNTQSFSRAISALAKQGGGHLVVPSGIFLTGPLSLKDRMDLHLEHGAVILFTPDKSAYVRSGSPDKTVPCLSVSSRKDVSITGEGILDGNGAQWRVVKRNKVSDVEWQALLRRGGTVSADGSLWYPFGLNGLPDIAPTAQDQEKMRTHLVRFSGCERVLVQGVTLQQSPKFHLVPQRCTDVVVDE